jgi:opacity protein-like surface antigen
MRLRVPGVAFLLLVFSGCFAGGDFVVTGAREAGIGFSSVTLADEWSAFNNPGGLGRFRRFSAGISVDNRFLVKETTLKNLSVTIPAGKGTFGLVIRHDGFSLYNELHAGVAYGRMLGKYFSAGVQIYCLRIGQAEGYGNKFGFSCEAGLQYKAADRLTFGVHIVNPTSPVLISGINERLPASIRIGMSCNISNDFMATLEAEKDLLHPLIMRTGFEYHLAKPFYARAGISINPSTFTMGAGLEFGPLKFDLAACYQPVPGFSPQASVTCLFK